MSPSDPCCREASPKTRILSSVATRVARLDSSWWTSWLRCHRGFCLCQATSGGGSTLEGSEASSVLRGLRSCTFTCLSIHVQPHPPHLSAWASDSSISAFSPAPQTTASGGGLRGPWESTGDWASFWGTRCCFWLGREAQGASPGSREPASGL